jgi:CheY-like chemotaxis protein
MPPCITFMKPKKTVLIVDDDLEDQEIFTETLRSIDQSVKCVKCFDGRHAIRILAEGLVAPNVIFLDLNMPIMNGYEFLKEIKKHSYLSHIPVIIYTTSSDRKHKQQAIELGASSFITKPTDLDELKKQLESVLLETYQH